MLKRGLIYVLMSALILAPVLAPPTYAKSRAEKEAAHAAKVKAEIANAMVREKRRGRGGRFLDRATRRLGDGGRPAFQGL